ncbi:hypothetical protein KC726_05830 [Candidatus Woesebacteria bacterium]|nr:hypothetical protein [Candidatus Woesebacteria bacterium]
MSNTHKPTSGDDKRAHLAMIQGVIDRMGGNLFYLRGWSITILVGLFAVSTSSLLAVDQWTPTLFFVLLLLFWVYDGYFLSLERKYRGLYDKVRMLAEEDIDFSMSVGEFKTHADKTILAAMLSPTLLAFYGVLGVAMVIIIKLTL